MNYETDSNFSRHEHNPSGSVCASSTRANVRASSCSSASREALLCGAETLVGRVPSSDDYYGGKEVNDT